MQRVVHIASLGGLKKNIAQGRRRAPAFLEAQRGAQSLACDIESSALVAEDVAPAARSRGASGGVAAERKRTGAGNSDNPRFAGRRAGEGYQAVVCDD